MFISEAFAQTTDAAASGAQGGGPAALMQFLPLVIIFVIFYVLLIRPQQKRARDHQRTLDNLKKGDRVVTGGGIIGTISKIEGVEAIVEIADGVRVRVQKATIGMVLTDTATGAVVANDSAK